MSPTGKVSDAESTQQSTCILPPNTNFESANRRFLFTMSNRTSYKFVLHGSRKECGVLDAPFKELIAGTTNNPSELYMRGYKTDFSLYGVTYTLEFRILEADDKDTNYRLNIFIGIGEATQNYFGWYICATNELILSPKKWFRAIDSKTDYNRVKTDYKDRVLNKGGKHDLRASCDQLKLNIEMITDNQAYSTPTMIIKDMI